ncbi:MAG: hypothetical protein KJZ91_07635 [Myxococcales bacterium]|nr:hypothetical protein [Myxococcales bacterium]
MARTRARPARVRPSAAGGAFPPFALSRASASERVSKGARGAALIALATVTTAITTAARAEPARPVGALGLGGDLALSGPSPRQRAAVDLTLYVRQRLGVYAAARQVTLSPLADAGQLTLGVAYRAAAARPRLELVLHGDAGVAWPLAPVAGGGVTTYLWPTRLPLALTTGASVYLIVDGVDATRLAVSLGLGLAVAR